MGPVFSAFRGEHGCRALPIVRAAHRRFRRLSLPGFSFDRSGRGHRSGVLAVTPHHGLIEKARDEAATDRSLSFPSIFDIAAPLAAAHSTTASDFSLPDRSPK